MLMKRVFLASLLCWSVGFFYGGFNFQGIPINNITETAAKNKSAYGISDDWIQNSYLIAKNNLTGILFLVLGGLLCGIPTISMLAWDGYLFANNLLQAIYVKKSVWHGVRYFIPHSIEFVGIWCAGACGLRIAFLLIKYLSNDVVPAQREASELLKYLLLSTFVIVLASALEAGVSLEMIKP